MILKSNQFRVEKQSLNMYMSIIVQYINTLNLLPYKNFIKCHLLILKIQTFSFLQKDVQVL